MDDVVKTGTTTLAMLSKEGIILAADKRATAGNFIAFKNIDKIIPINDYMALTTAGSVSDIQLLVKILKAEINLKDIRTGRQTTVKEAAGISHFIFAGYDSVGPAIYDIYPDGSIQEVQDFVASGSGSTFAYGLIEAQFKKGMSLAECQDLALKAVSSALQRDSASGNGIDVVAITKNGVKKLVEKSIAE